MKNKGLALSTGLFFSISLINNANTFYISPSGVSTNDGSNFESPLDVYTALCLVEAGDSIVLQEGVYVIPYITDTKNTINFTKSGMEDSLIYMLTIDSTHAVFDFSFHDTMWVKDSYGFYVTGSYWYFKGIDITRAGYQGVYVEGAYNTFDNCRFYKNRNTGLEINKGGSYTTVLNCDAYQNYDPKKDGSMADGFGPKQTQGSGNKFIGCRAWENSDDGYDCFDSPEIVTFENCWAFRNGVNVLGYEAFAGNGNGFKVGGNYQVANNVLTNCVAFGHPKKGFDQNNNKGRLTFINCTAYGNGTNFGLGNAVNSGQQHVLRNNISLNGPNSISNALQEYNSWNIGFSVSEADFQSLDFSVDTFQRNSNSSIPETSLLRLDSFSLLVDAGMDVGLPFIGNAPDLGCFESPYSRTPESINQYIIPSSFDNYPNPFKGETTFIFELIQSSIVTIRLYDLTGKTIDIVVDDYLDKGLYQMKYDGAGLYPGIYVVMMNYGSRVLCNKVVVTAN